MKKFILLVMCIFVFSCNYSTESVEDENVNNIIETVTIKKDKRQEIGGNELWYYIYDVWSGEEVAFIKIPGKSFLYEVFENKDFVINDVNYCCPFIDPDSIIVNHIKG